MTRGYAKKLALWLLDIVCVTISFVIASNLRFDQPMSGYTYDSNRAVYAAMLVVTFVFNFTMQDNRGFMRRSGGREFGVVVRYSFLIVLGVILASYAFRIEPSPSRIMLLGILVINVVVMCVGRWMAKLSVRAVFRGERAGSPIVMVVGQGERPKVESTFMPGLTYSIAGWLEASGTRLQGSVEGKPISCLTVELPDAFHAANIERVPDFYVCAPAEPEHNVAEIVDAAERLGANCHVSIDMPYPSIQGARLGYFGELPVITYSSGGGDLYRRYIKRALDVVFSMLVLVLLSWLYLIVAIVIKIDDPHGSVFFKQRRIGKDGKPFTMWKFRSMYSNAEERLVALQQYNEKDGPVFKIKDDPRITRVGHFIRKTSLDEMPQFLNVLKGDMSIVGPRPALAREVAQYTPHQRERLLVRPGLTCYWQVQRNRDDIPFDEWIDLDLLYIRQCSFDVDARLVARTVGVVFTAQGS